MGNGKSTMSAGSAEISLIKNMIQDHCVVIFSKTTCSYCGMAKRVFEDIDTPYHAVELNKREDGYKIQEALAQMTGANTVPRVFINGECVGGGTETRDLQQSGKLIPLLQACRNPSEKN